MWDRKKGTGLGKIHEARQELRMPKAQHAQSSGDCVGAITHHRRVQRK